MPQNDHDDAFTGESGYTDNVDEVPSADTGFNMDPNENDANGDPNVATTALTALTADDAPDANGFRRGRGRVQRHGWEDGLGHEERDRRERGRRGRERAHRGPQRG